MTDYVQLRYFALNDSLSKTLKKFLGIDADPGDGLPNAVCAECVNALDFWYVNADLKFVLLADLTKN